MSSSDMAVLGLILAAFAVFIVTLWWASWRWERQGAPPRSGPRMRHDLLRIGRGAGRSWSGVGPLPREPRM